jgi:hypothetical protein
LEHQLGAGGRKRDEAQLVQDNQVVFEGGGQEFRQPVLILSQDEFIDQGGGIVKADAMALPTSSQSQPGGDVTFNSTMTMPP